jgi:hypothetical protein
MARTTYSISRGPFILLAFNETRDGDPYVPFLTSIDIDIELPLPPSIGQANKVVIVTLLSRYLLPATRQRSRGTIVV